MSNSNQPISQNQDTSYDTISNQQELGNFKEKLNLATHNVRGINNLTKLQLWIDFCLEEKLHIVGITETKLKNNPQALTNPHYKIYTSNLLSPNTAQHRETSMGTAILVHNTLQPYIHDINTFPGTTIYIDFFFPRNKTRIISIYLPSNNKELSTRTQTQISLWTIFPDLISNDLTSLLNFHKISEPTWKGRGLTSQIDDIWTYLKSY